MSKPSAEAPVTVQIGDPEAELDYGEAIVIVMQDEWLALPKTIKAVGCAIALDILVPSLEQSLQPILPVSSFPTAVGLIEKWAALLEQNPHGAAKRKEKYRLKEALRSNRTLDLLWEGVFWETREGHKLEEPIPWDQRFVALALPASFNPQRYTDSLLHSLPLLSGLLDPAYVPLILRAEMQETGWLSDIPNPRIFVEYDEDLFESPTAYAEFVEDRRQQAEYWIGIW